MESKVPSSHPVRQKPEQQLGPPAGPGRHHETGAPLCSRQDVPLCRRRGLQHSRHSRTQSSREEIPYL